MDVLKYMLLVTIMFIVSVVILFLAINLLNDEKKKNEELKKKIEEQTRNLAFLVKHSEEMAVICNNKTETEHKIQGAKTDEEIAEIINTIISFNNSKLPNDS